MNFKELSQITGSLAARVGELHLTVEKKNEIIREKQRVIQRQARELAQLRKMLTYGWPN